jgi:CheY-like chemotaxis protein
LAIRLLEDQGHVVTVVNNGKEAVHALCRGDFDLVLMDIDMPEMDGLTATREIRACEKRKDGRVPIVAVTTNDNLRECLDAGMDAHLPKPLRLEPLSRALDDVLGKVAA